MGKRAANIITIEEVAEEIDEAAGKKGAGRDALRFFFLSRGGTRRSSSTSISRRRSALDNPVFYVQYGTRGSARSPRRRARSGSRRTDAHGGGVEHPHSPRRARARARASAEFPTSSRAPRRRASRTRSSSTSRTSPSEFQSYFTRLKNGRPDPAEGVAARAGGLGEELGLTKDGRAAGVGRGDSDRVRSVAGAARGWRAGADGSPGRGRRRGGRRLRRGRRHEELER